MNAELTAVTTDELIELVQRWVKRDRDEESDEPLTKQEMYERCQRAIAARPPEQAISEDLIRGIINTNAPDAPVGAPKEDEDDEESASNVIQMPAPKMEAEVSSFANAPTKRQFTTDDFAKAGGRFDESHSMWFIKRCSGYQCGEFGGKHSDECQEPKIHEVAFVMPDGRISWNGRQALGLDPIRRPERPEPRAEIKSQLDMDFAKEFTGSGEVVSHGIKMLVENFIQDKAITFIAGLPKDHKTHLALSITKALTTGRPLMGRMGYETPEIVPVLYLNGEVGDERFKTWVDKFGITQDKALFAFRTLTKGVVRLNDPNLEAWVRTFKPVIILDVWTCFNESEDESDAVENRRMRQLISNLLRIGARAVIILHHGTKTFRQNQTKENALRGSIDILGMLDCEWMLLKDEHLEKATGIEEVEVWGTARDFSPIPFRFAATRKASSTDLFTFRPGVVSIIDTEGDLAWIDKEAAQRAAEAADQSAADTLEQMVKADPTVTSKALAKATGKALWSIKALMKELGYSKPSGRAKKGQPHRWVKNAA